VTALMEIVQNAYSTGQTVKAFGSRHSITDVICTDGIPISMKNFNYKQINSDGTATFGSGLELHDAMEYLEEQGLSLIMVPTFGTNFMIIQNNQIQKCVSYLLPSCAGITTWNSNGLFFRKVIP